MTLSAEKLFNLIRKSFGYESNEIQLSDDDYSELIKIGKKQSILPILYRSLKKTDCPEDYLNTISSACNKDFYLYIQQNEALKNLNNILNQAQVPYVNLKGAVLRKLYQSPEMRTGYDIDVLVHEEDINKALKAIEENLDFKVSKRGYHDIALLNKNSVQLELHFNIKENSENIDRMLVKAWDYTVPAEDGYRFDFTSEYQIFYITAHMSYHFLHGGLGIRPFLDLWLLRKKTEYDEEAVRKMCSECGILKFYEESCNLSEVWLEEKEHTETTKMFEQFCLSGGVFGSGKFSNAVRQRNNRGVKYILSRVFPPAYQVKEYYKDESGKEHLLPYYYVKRWLSWSSNMRREDLNSQIHTIMNSDQSYLDMTEELMSRLEM